MITGFNTDIEFGGTVYHVQTEDKGLNNPLILSLVYVGGAILASKRSPYTDLIETGFDERVLVERLNRQHKLICAAIRSGRIDDLKRMSDPVPPPAVASTPAGVETQTTVETHAETPVESKVETVAEAAPAVQVPKTPEQAPPVAAAPSPPQPPPAAASPIQELMTNVYEPIYPHEVYVKPPTPAPPVEPEPITPTPSAPATILPETEEPHVEELPDELYLSILDDEGDFRAGELVTIRIHVGRGRYGIKAVSGAAVTVKVLGTTFRPLILSTLTDDDGVAVVRALLPRFTSGRAAILIRAIEGEEEAELRRIIHQA